MKREHELVILSKINQAFSVRVGKTPDFLIFFLF